MKQDNVSFTTSLIDNLDWNKMAGLIPAIIQNYQTAEVLMLGYMNKAALEKTITTGQVTFYSRSKKRLWVKGETSGNYLKLINIIADCDQDSLLVYVEPIGNTCHLGNDSCFASDSKLTIIYFALLDLLIKQRAQEKPNNSYTVSLLKQGNNRIAQKVGEEAVETVIATMTNDKQNIINETADLLYHLLVLLRANDVELGEIITELRNRMKT